MANSIKAAIFSCALLLCIGIPSSIAQTCRSHNLISTARYTTCSDLPALSSFLYWNYHTQNQTADIAFRKTGTTTTNWVAWALNPSGQQMAGSQAIVAYHSNGSPTAITTQIESTSPTMQRSNLSFGVTNLNAQYSNGEMIIFATLQLDTTLVSTNQVWQEGPMSGGSPSIHPLNSANRASVGSINFATGASAGGSAPTSKKKNVHGVLNAVSWGILMPMGVMIARYVKVFKIANPAWFYLHAFCQTSAYGVGVAGWATGLKLGSDSPGVKYSKHRNIGITLFCLATLQVFALLLRPKPDHKYRLYWNIYHHAIGYATIALSIANIYEGLDILDPEKKWKTIYTVIIIVLGGIALFMEALTWVIVLKRKKTSSSDKYSNGTNGANGYAARGQNSV